MTSDGGSAPGAGGLFAWPSAPVAQVLVVGSAAVGFLFVSAGAYLPFVLLGVAMPWLTAAYVATRRDEVQFLGPTVDERSTVGYGGLLLYPAMAFRALFDTDFNATAMDVVVPSLLLGGTCLGAWLWADPVARARPLVAAALSFQALAWGVGAGVLVNVRFDRSTPAVVEARVVDTARWRSKRRPLPTYGLAFEQFGMLTVPEEVFGSQPAGSLACVQLHGGRLGIGWLSVERCPRPPRTSRPPAAR